MLPSAATYDELVSSFRWDIPEHYNIGLDCCDRWAAAEPERVAIIDMTGDMRRDVSFAELKDMSDRLASYLAASGVAAGDRVGVLRRQSAWTAAAHFAIWKLGAISMPLFTLFREEALKMRITDSGAKLVIVDEVGAEMLGDAVRAIEPEKLDFLDTAYPETVTRAEDPAVLIYTSGTTGAPKGAVLPHRVLLGHLPGVEMSHDQLPQDGDVLWTPADWAWIGGLFDVLMPGLHHGVPVVANRMQKFDPLACKDLIEKLGIRNVFFPPTALKMLRASGVCIKGLRSVASGGEPLGAELLEWGREALGVTINEFYGQTECNMTVSSCSTLFPARAGAIGRAVPGHDVKVIDADGQPSIGEGNIAVRKGSASMMLEYWNNSAATAQKYRGEWMLTGDRGVMEDGFIRFVGRDDDVITSAGYRIGPAPIEDCLLRHPAVLAAGVVGKPDALKGEIVKAYIELKPDVHASQDLAKDLQDHVASTLAAHEYPREISFVNALPMTVTGKIIRKELKARAISETKKKAS